MEYYSIFFEDRPVFEGRDGQYWLGGTKSIMDYLIFSSKKKALEGLKCIKERIKNSEQSKHLLGKNLDKLNVARFKITKL